MLLMEDRTAGSPPERRHRTAGRCTRPLRRMRRRLATAISVQWPSRRRGRRRALGKRSMSTRTKPRRRGWRRQPRMALAAGYHQRLKREWNNRIDLLLMFTNDRAASIYAKSQRSRLYDEHLLESSTHTLSILAICFIYARTFLSTQPVKKAFQDSLGRIIRPLAFGDRFPHRPSGFILVPFTTTSWFTCSRRKGRVTDDTDGKHLSIGRYCSTTG